jgi:hypothetical protein
MAYKASDYPQVKRSSEKYDVAKAKRIAIEKDFNGAKTTDKNYSKLKAAIVEAKSQEETALKNYRSVNEAAKADYNKKATAKKSQEDAASAQKMIAYYKEQLQKARDAGEATTNIEANIKNQESKLADANAPKEGEDAKGELGSNYYTGRGTKQNLFLQNGKPFTGTYNNRKYKDGIDTGLTAEEAAATKEGTDAKAKKDAEDKAKTDKAKADAAAKGSGGTGDAAPKVTGDLTTPGKAAGGKQGPGVGVRDALKIPGRAEPAFQELIDKADFNFGLPDYIFTVDRDKKTGELGQLGKLLLEAVENGLTNEQFLDKARLTDWWQSNSGSVRERIIDLNKYKELQGKGLDVSKSDFGMYQTDKMRQVKARAKALAGITLDDAAAQKIVEDIYNGFLDNDPLAIDRLIIPYVSKSTNLYGQGAVTGFGGEALQVQQSLASIAKANGLSVADILPKLGGTALGKDAEQNAIQEILSGNVDLNTLLSNARQIAAQGQPEYVRNLLGSGYNLEDIYAPYKKTMASVLELDPEQIDLNDNSLRMAINEKGDMNIYDYKKALRQDSRWQYTGQAKESVATAALGVLRDFGFQG